MGEWEIYQTNEVADWIENLRHTDPEAADRVEAAVDVLSEYGPTLGRPLGGFAYRLEDRESEGVAASADDDPPSVRL